MLRVVLKPLISDIPLIGGVQVSSFTHIGDLDPEPIDIWYNRGVLSDKSVYRCTSCLTLRVTTDWWTG